MSKSVLSVTLYNGNKSDDSQEESTSKDTNLVNSLKSNMKLNLLYDFNNTNIISAYGIPGKMLSHLQKCYSHISLKFLPYSSQKSFSRNVRLYHRFDKYQCKDYFHFFTKLCNLKKQTRNILTQKKVGYIKHKTRNDHLYMNNKPKKIKELHSCTSNKEETNRKVASCCNNVSLSNIHSYCAYTFEEIYNHPVATPIFPKIQIEEILPLDNVADSLANLNLNQVKVENNSAPSNLLTKSKGNFCSGDNSRNAYSNLKYLINDMSDTKELVQVHSENISSKTRSIQWSTEVNVIYYAGDVNGDKEIWKEVEPLHEEACQQAWQDSLVQITRMQTSNK
ncbi:hypothetical protein KPH14_002527 [Odynerus spinipes]|uniref:Uncharacterized protein n=1 Tax=Odynerus spinipes TaxID=1348599 RepID=A0AAD9RS38_9HYME|nr:hypothetical protein KPH14_002527 [Odynerus spinipes]